MVNWESLWFLRYLKASRLSVHESLRTQTQEHTRTSGGQCEILSLCFIVTFSILFVKTDFRLSFEMTSKRNSSKLKLRRSFSEQLRTSTSKAWDLLWKNVRERRLAAIISQFSTLVFHQPVRASLTATIFVSPPTPYIIHFFSLTQFIGIPVVFIFPSRAGGVCRAFIQTLASVQKGGPYFSCFLAIGFTVVTWPATHLYSSSLGSTEPSLSALFRLFAHVYEVFCCVWVIVLQALARGLFGVKYSYVSRAPRVHRQ
ncbi:hypothetical protein GOODEAATRI_006909 [Goodea atripinnis]|uniref:Transmembrane protein n=1 Tax=Goodea atripinnis TaxID=208336 RepID=A0ABV0P3S7_9TELE